MKIIELDGKFPEHIHPPRSEGFHLSTVLDYIENTLGIGKSGRVFTEEDKLYAELGFLWEGVLRERDFDLLDPSQVYIGEFELDGIIGSPDGVDLINEVVYEYKCTWKSPKKHPIETETRWLWQVKSYCKMVGYSTVVFRVLYINGDYSPIRPIYHTYHITFTQEELDENWNMVLTNARDGGYL